MTAYYTGMIYLTCFAMGIMALIVHSSDWLDREKQRQFQVIFATVAAAAGAEWLTVFLDGSGPGLRWLHLGVKVLELTIAPFVAVEFLRALDAEKRARQLKWLLIVHGAVEVAAAPFGLIVAFDANNVYVHGELYWIYVAVYFTAALVFIWEGVRFGRRNQAAGGNIMALILVFFASGVAMRLCNRQIRADYPCLAFAVMFTYLYYSGVVQNADALTGLRNRRGYDSQLSHLRRPAILLMMDVNRFKAVNDQFGHQYGDRVLQTIARAMQRAYGREGRCYRIGGDEFCVIFDGSQDQARTRTEQFRALLAAEREKLPRLPDVAVGMTHFDPAETDPDSAVKQADREMYENKAAGRSNP